MAVAFSATVPPCFKEVALIEALMPREAASALFGQTGSTKKNIEKNKTKINISVLRLTALVIKKSPFAIVNNQ